MHTFFDDRTGNALGNRLPFTAADIDAFRLGVRPANGVAHVAIACLRDGTTGRVTLIAPAGLRHRAADGVAAIAVACLIARLADRVALITPAGLHTRHTNGVALVAVARLVARHANCAALVAPAGLRHWAAAGIALIAVAGFIAGLGAADRILLADLIIDRLAADFLTTVPHDFLKSFVASRAASFGLAQITTWGTCGGRAAVVAGRSTITRLGGVSSRQQQEQHRRADPDLAFHRSNSSDSVSVLDSGSGSSRWASLSQATHH